MQRIPHSSPNSLLTLVGPPIHLSDALSQCLLALPELPILVDDAFDYEKLAGDARDSQAVTVLGLRSWSRTHALACCTGPRAQPSLASSVAGPMAPAAPQGAVFDDSLDLLGHTEYAAAAAAAAPAKSGTAASKVHGEGLLRQSGDSLALLDAADQGKSLSLSGWNQDAKPAQNNDVIGSTGLSDPVTARV